MPKADCDLSVSLVWSIFSHGPSSLTVYFWVLWATEQEMAKVSGQEVELFGCWAQAHFAPTICGGFFFSMF